MSIEPLSQAISLIKSGDTQGGQKLLAEVVRSDPGNETAWLWLSSVAPADKRRYCLDRVLKINPENALAKQLMEQLQRQETQPPVAVAASAPVSVQVESVGVDAPVAPMVNLPEHAPTVMEPPATEYWALPANKEVRIILLQGTKLLSFYVMPDKVSKVVAQIDRVEMTKEWYSKNIALGLQSMTYKSVPINRTLRVHLSLSVMDIHYRDETGRDMSISISCKENAAADALMASLQKRLGEKYVFITQPTSRKKIVLWSAIGLLLSIGATSLFYFFAGGLQGTEIQGAGRAKSMGRILQLLGPNGVLCIGGILLIFVLIVVIYTFTHPPIETILIHKSLLAEQQAKNK